MMQKHDANDVDEMFFLFCFIFIYKYPQVLIFVSIKFISSDFRKQIFLSSVFSWCLLTQKILYIFTYRSPHGSGDRGADLLFVYSKIFVRKKNVVSVRL